MYKKMRDKYKKLRGNKAFTLVELIVTVSIVAILVLLAMPRINGYVDKAKLARIQHDTRVMENKMEEVFSAKNNIKEEWNGWVNNDKDLGTLILRKQLYEYQGRAKRVERAESYSFRSDWVESDRNEVASVSSGNLGQGGPLISTEDSGYGYKIIPDEYKRIIGTKLDGTFYTNSNAKVYYEPNKPLSEKLENEIAPNCIAPMTLDYEFEHQSGTIVKYNGTLQYLTIPESFLVDGECWPVKVIGRGAFARGSFPRDKPILEIEIPQGVEKIEEEAFKDNEIEDVVIPPGVTDIGDNAFTGPGNGENVTIKRPEGSTNIKPDAFNPGVSPKYETPTDKEIGVNVKPNRKPDGTIEKSPSGRPTGSIGSSSTQKPSIPSNKENNSDPSQPSKPSQPSNGNVVIIPDVIIVDDVEVEITEIEQGGFQGEGLIHVTLPSGLLRIEDYAFAGNQLIGVDIPNNVGHIGNYAFSYNELYDGSNYKWSINYIEFSSVDKINKVNKKVGDIEENGVKVNNLSSSTLKDHIWLTSTGVEVNKEYNPSINGSIPDDPIDFDTNGREQEFIVPATGNYKLEVWGAQGGHGDSRAGKGGFSEGEIRLNKGDKLLTYIGGSNGYNGGASSNRNEGYGGGGTDIRINGSSLTNRIIVAGGGGGRGARNASSTRGNGGAGGGATGITGTAGYGSPGYGGSQTSGGSGGRNANSGRLGFGGTAGGSSGNGRAGGGGGYYGGGGGGNDHPSYNDYDDSGAGGGSGYIGGVQNGNMIAGNQSMPNPDGGTMIGKSGNGFARITYIGR